MRRNFALTHHWHQRLSVFIAGYAEMIRQFFPPIPEPGFRPDFTGYDFDNTDWYEAYETMAQSPGDAIKSVRRSV